MSSAALHSLPDPDPEAPIAQVWPPSEPSGVDAFLERHRPRFESRLARVSADLGSGVGGLPEVVARAVGTDGRGGRRWRPMLTLAAAEATGAMGGSEEEAVLDVAVAVELTHTASLVLDDMPCMDDSASRRGEPATHRLVGSAGAILLSVGMLARAVELLGGHDRAGGAVCEQWGRAIGLRGMAGGQAMDVAAKGPLRGSARRLHRAKSSLLPAFALASGAKAAGAGAGICVGLDTFGRSLGWAYQLLDDVEDLEEDARLGRVTSGLHPLALSRRIMRRAYRRLRRQPGLDEAGREILIGLAGRVVMSEASLGSIATSAATATGSSTGPPTAIPIPTLASGRDRASAGERIGQGRR